MDTQKAQLACVVTSLHTALFHTGTLPSREFAPNGFASWRSQVQSCVSTRAPHPRLAVGQASLVTHWVPLLLRWHHSLRFLPYALFCPTTSLLPPPFRAR
jgi:hypothetical protein